MVSVVGLIVLVVVSFGLVIACVLLVVGRVYFTEVVVAGAMLVGTPVAGSVVSPSDAVSVEISALEVTYGSAVVYSTEVSTDVASVD